MVRIWEVTYPDVRRGEGGFSTALYPTEGAAERMARRFPGRAKVTSRLITRTEYLELVRTHFLP